MLSGRGGFFAHVFSFFVLYPARHPCLFKHAKSCVSNLHVKGGEWQLLGPPPPLNFISNTATIASLYLFAVSPFLPLVSVLGYLKCRAVFP
jgi:hypothetical protein